MSGVWIVTRCIYYEDTHILSVHATEAGALAAAEQRVAKDATEGHHRERRKDRAAVWTSDWDAIAVEWHQVQP